MTSTDSVIANMRSEGYYSRHYVNWMRHLFYRDALKLRSAAITHTTFVIVVMRTSSC